MMLKKEIEKLLVKSVPLTEADKKRNYELLSEIEEMLRDESDDSADSEHR